MSDGWEEAVALRDAAWPATLTHVGYAAWGVLCIAAAAHDGGVASMVPTGAALACLYVTHSLPCSLARGLRALRHTGDDQDDRPPGQSLQVALLVYTAAMVPFGLLWCFATGDALRAMHLHSAAAEGQRFARYCVPWMYAHGVKTAVDHHHAAEPAACRAAGLSYGTASVLGTACIGLLTAAAGLPLVHVPLGIALATLLHLAALGTYASCSGAFAPWWRGCGAGGLRWGVLWGYLGAAVPEGVSALLIEGQLHLLVVFAAQMGEPYVAAWSAIAAGWALLLACTSGLADAAGARVLLHLQHGSTPLARDATAYAALAVAAVSVSAGLLLVVLRHKLGSAMVGDSGVAHNIDSAVPVAAAALLPTCAGLLGLRVLEAQGRHLLGRALVATCLWCISVPVCAVLTYVWDRQLPWLLAGHLLGSLVSMMLVWLRVVTDDWGVMLEAQQEHMAHTSRLVHSCRANHMYSSVNSRMDDDIIAAARESDTHSP